ncbi:glycine--tRNA ligase subunit beta [Sphingomonas sp.]|uniref:glycine--tRNA ligase subunit beta n=1 Tax=Sphingomonas sp. TaxID=28214 RepID=UPI00286A0BF4|nr:glycine--tRNA ligase subunit beta [Sphingomonas sp.]
MTDFLLELLSEEIPARMQAKARNDLARLFADALDKAGLAHAGITTWSTPRRLALIARGVAAETVAVREELKGPRSSAPAQALEGFLRKTGLTQGDLEERDGVWFAVIDRPGRSAVDVLGEAIAAIVHDFPWPKSMRWGAASASMSALRWVRPLHSIVALLGDEIVPVRLDYVQVWEKADGEVNLKLIESGIVSGATTLGHRFHHPGPITIGGASDYAAKLRACHVIVDHEEREAIVRDGARAAAKAAGLTLVEDEGLVVENAGLTEWPVPLLGQFDPDYLDVPREVIVLTMRTNQKYFACVREDGGLAPALVCTANIAANDGGAAIVEGNRRVLAARFSDARFFWEQDLKVPLQEQAAKLSGIVFHEKLGTVADKVERVAKLARWLCEEGIVGSSPGGGGEPSAQPMVEGPRDTRATPVAPPLHHPADGPPPPAGEDLASLAERAARLCKADLVTGMVGEFPELQGVIGGYLAEAQGEPKAVSDAIRDHYKPIGHGDEVPTAPVTVAVSLADKLDSVFSFFAIDETPTGSKDPFALRRSTLSILSLQTSSNLRFDIEAVYRNWASAAGYVWPESADGLERVRYFFADRLKVQQRDAGVRHDLIDAVFALGGEDDLVRLLARVTALQGFVETGEGADLLAGYKRAANILKKEQGSGIPGKARDDGGIAVEEAALVAALDAAEPRAEAAIEAEEFTAAMTALASLRTPIDAFFEKVTVNDPEPAIRARRLTLLARFRDAVHRVADFSKIEG